MKKQKITKNKKDLFITLTIATLLTILFISFDAFESYIEYTKEHEEYELDEILLVLFTFSICGLWYSFRRYNEVEELKKILEKDNNQLEEDNTKKDDLLLEQMKMATLGEMLQNIAHQWRQPLNSINISASTIIFEQEMGTLDTTMAKRSLENIVKNTTYLSETIDHFRSYIKENQVSKEFNLNENIENCLDLVSSSIKNSYINIVMDLNTNINITSYPSELTQVLINIINNAKDALEMNNIEDKYIFISSKVMDDRITITILDNAGGIDEKIINKIFEPYFSTKDSLNGTGLGLYMSYKLITERMNGKIAIKNSTYKHDNKDFTGAKFLIEIPKVNEQR